MEVRLTPSGNLHCDCSEGETLSPASIKLSKIFQIDWREGLFSLASAKASPDASPTTLFWQDFAKGYLTMLCHVPEAKEFFAIEKPSPAELASMIVSSPPMTGGEYLTADTLIGVWQALDGWVRERASQQGLKAFLEQHAPEWNQVGLVCFHLAENRNDPEYPFAFLATYSTGIGTTGKLRQLPLRKALEEYAGRKDRSAMINLLSPVMKASEKCAWVHRIVEHGEIYQPMAWTANQAYGFLQSVPDLEECGLSVRLPDWWKKRPRPRVSVTIEQKNQPTLGKDALLDFDVRTALGDETLTPQELVALLAGEDGLVFFKGQWIEVDRAKLQTALDHWQSINKKAKRGEISFFEGMRLLAGASADMRFEEQLPDERTWAHVEAGDGLRKILEGLRQPARLAALDAADGMATQLRPYQKEGVSWLYFLTGLGFGACLADDMGLGKTLQVLALLLCLQPQHDTERRRPSLLVVPASLLGNWRNEAVRFTPKLKLAFLHPAEADHDTIKDISASPNDRLGTSDLAITTYAMLSRQEWLKQVDWHLLILDEAQAIKNPSTRQSKAAKALKAKGRIALTGTPVENRLGDLWSIFDFLNPGLLGSATVFQNFVKSMQQSQRNQIAPLRKLVSPYILRRLKTDRSIIADLPEKTEIERYCNLSVKQIKLYEKTVSAMRAVLESADGMARRGLVLQTLMRLKQICNHPSQLSGDGAYDAVDSGKFRRLEEICEEIASRQERVLIFTQFREIIDPLTAHLARVFGRNGLHLHGGTPIQQRKKIVEQFQSENGPPFFVLSLKAGGTGLNLTSASHVIHFDRWWNPAVENQATDRAFRIGQKRNVLVHKFITSGTVEERIDKMINEKKEIAEEILSADREVDVTELSDDQLLELVRLDVTRAKG